MSTSMAELVDALMKAQKAIEEYSSSSEEKQDQEKPLLYTTEEVAGILRVNKSTVTRMCKKGEIAARKIGREWRISRQALFDATNTSNSFNLNNV